MKTKKITGFLILLMIALFTGCGGGGGGSSAVLKSLVLDTTSETVVQNGTFTLPKEAKVIYDNDEEKKVSIKWNKEVDTTEIGQSVYMASYEENGIKVTAEFILNVTAQKTVAGISLVKNSDITTIGSSYKLDTKAMAIYDDQTTKEVEVTWDKPADTTKAGTFQYTAIYSENGVIKTALFNLTVKEQAKLIEIKLKNDSAKTAEESPVKYLLPTTATATYDDQTTKEVEVTWDKPADTTKAGTFQHTAIYSENGVIKTALFTLTVEAGFINKLKSIEFSPSNIEVQINANVVLPSKANALYENGEIKSVSVTWITSEKIDTTKAGSVYSVASYTETYSDGDTIIKTANYEVKVSKPTPKLTGIALNVKNASVELNQVYELPQTAIATYDDGITKEIKVTWDKPISTSEVGLTAYIATYTEDGITKTDNFILTVNKTVLSFMITTTEATVNVGDIYALPLTGVIIYSDMTTENVNITWDKPINTTTAGKYIYIGSSTKTSKTVQFTLTVNAVEKGVLQISDTTAEYAGEYVEVVMSASDFSKMALTADITVNYDAAALEFAGAALMGNISTAAKNESSSYGTAKVTATMQNGAVLSGQIIKFRFKTLKSGESQVKIGAANIVDITGVTLIQAVITDTATVKVGTGTVSNKIEIADVTGVTNSEVELKVTGSGFTTTAMGIDVILSFDTNYLEIVKESNGEISSSIVTILNKEFTSELVIVKEVSAGKIRVAIITMNGSKVNLNSDIFKVRFKTKSNAADTVVTLGEVEIAETVGTYIQNINAADTAKVTIEQGTSTTSAFEISDEITVASGYTNVKITAKNFTTETGGVEFMLEYDSSYLSIESESDITFTGVLAGGMKIVSLKSGEALIAGIISKDEILNGEVLNIKFKTAAKTGNTEIKLKKAEIASAKSSTVTLINSNDTGKITIN